MNLNSFGIELAQKMMAYNIRLIEMRFEEYQRFKRLIIIGQYKKVYFNAQWIYDKPDILTIDDGFETFETDLELTTFFGKYLG